MKNFDDNRAYCKRIADEIEAYASGKVYRCSECGEIHYSESGHCPDCEGEGEQLSLWDYFEDVLDIEWTIDSRREFLGARFYVTLGGPTCWIDTRSKSVELRWGGESACYSLDWDTAEEVEQYAEELFNC